MIKKIFMPAAFILWAFFCILTLTVAAQQNKPQGFKGPVVFINLMLPSSDTLLLVDGTAAMYASYFSDGVDEYDAGKLPNFNENICLVRDGQKLAVEARKIPIMLNDTLFVNMWGMQKQDYILQIAPQNLSAMLASAAWLRDNYSNKEIPLHLSNKTIYRFTTDANVNSYQNRFSVIFNRRMLDAEPVSLNRSMNTNGTVQVYPNPLSGNIIRLQFINMVKDNYSIKLTNLSGKILINKNIVHSGGDNEYYIALSSVYSPGIYSIIISGNKAEKAIHLPIVIN